jgi:hypothetical protein
MTKTEDEIVAENEAFMAEMFPRFKQNDKLTLHYLLSRALARSELGLYERIEEVLNTVDVLKATGTDLDHLVAAQLLTRRLGDYATGYLTFYRNTPSMVDITIPSGTRCKSGALFFKTTVEGVLSAGDVSVSVAATAEIRGLSGNVTDHTVTNIYSSVPGIDSVSNPISFVGGTDAETDDELRQRYIDVYTLPGLATSEMIARHLTDLDGVSDARVINCGSGDVEVIVDWNGGLTENNPDIVSELEAVLAAGCQARGCHAAIATPSGNIEPVIDPVSGEPNDTYGGWIFLRALEPVSTEDSFDIDYVNRSEITKTITATVPAGTQRGAMVQVAFDDPMDRAVLISTKTYTGLYNYDVLLGMGEPNYIYEIPTVVYASVYLNVYATDAPELNLKENIEASITAWLNDFLIGETLEWSDIRTCATIEYTSAVSASDKHTIQGSERVFIGINSIKDMIVSTAGQNVRADGETILQEIDEIIKAGTVTVNIIAP